MLDTIKSLYIQGKLGPNFRKVAELIIERESEKLAATLPNGPLPQRGPNYSTQGQEVAQQQPGLWDRLWGRVEQGDQVAQGLAEQGVRDQGLMAGISSWLKGSKEPVKFSKEQIDALAGLVSQDKGGLTMKDLERVLPDRDKQRLIKSLVNSQMENDAKSILQKTIDTLGANVPKALAGAATIGGVYGLSQLYYAGKRSLEQKAFDDVLNSVITSHPELDVTKARANYATLAQLAPHLALDENSVIGFLSQAQEWPYMLMDAAQKLTQTEKQIADSGGESTFSRSLSELGKGLSTMVAGFSSN